MLNLRLPLLLFVIAFFVASSSNAMGVKNQLPTIKESQQFLDNKNSPSKNKLFTHVIKGCSKTRMDILRAYIQKSVEAVKTVKKLITPRETREVQRAASETIYLIDAIDHGDSSDENLDKVAVLTDRFKKTLLLKNKYRNMDMKSMPKGEIENVGNLQSVPYRFYRQAQGEFAETNENLQHMSADAQMAHKRFEVASRAKVLMMDDFLKGVKKGDRDFKLLYDNHPNKCLIAKLKAITRQV